MIISYGIKPFDICNQAHELWKYIKISYIITFIFSNILISNIIFKYISNIYEQSDKSNKYKKNTNEMKILIGYDKQNNEKIYVKESGLYQNFLITGTIGSGKTSSAMYPFTRSAAKI